MNPLSSAATRLVILSVVFASTTTTAASLTVQVDAGNSVVVTDAVVYLESASGQALPKMARPAQIEQKGRVFIPAVTVIQSGASISFPNNDTVRHQVYSFSPAKVFELKLYSGAGGEPLLFDKPGTVVIGCNIHDKMSAYIQVVDTPYFAKTDNSGKAVIDNLPAGKYNLKVWYRTISPGIPVPEQAISFAGIDATTSFLLNKK
ncbi:methylamine utilization protein [Actimicrobium sp. CCI2.3]|uniref:methylamine utilization protein n=1 Tax=Actimicrobium sp. CCI2.3 TaxID=3048616 RepID=UPI002AB589FA|nr:methylamine utilization protein [Actimicrobium sp. CCI2.3]MDY7575181.1 methylamine utilization protein [Actimicrobium sp. CCI2.3]MEB0022356.1 methylamine utilization protein [Actimicrobium sp. CCI2.3]